MRTKYTIILGLILALLCSAYSAYWFYSATRIKESLTHYPRLTTQSITVSGFPTRFQFTLNAAVWEPNEAFTFSIDKVVITGNILHTSYQAIIGDITIKQPSLSLRQQYVNPLLKIELRTPLAWQKLPGDPAAFAGQIEHFSYSDEGMVSTDLKDNTVASQAAGNHVTIDAENQNDKRYVTFNFAVKDLLLKKNPHITAPINTTGDIITTIPIEKLKAGEKSTTATATEIAINNYAFSLGKTSLKANGKVQFSPGKRVPIGEITVHVASLPPLLTILAKEGVIRNGAELEAQLQKIAEPGATQEAMEFRIKAMESGGVTIGALPLPQIIALFADVNKTTAP